MAVDIGGTFTDLVVLNEETNEILLDKVPTVTANEAEGVRNSLVDSKVPLASVSNFVHGSTVAINAVIEGKGAKTGLITTLGFRDVYEIGRLRKMEIYNPRYRKPVPLVPRYLRKEVAERMSWDGSTIAKLDEDSVNRVLDEMDSERVKAIAVSLMNAYANPTHEKKIAELATRHSPTVAISLSHDVANEWREYERTSTTVMNAYVQPIVSKYLQSLEGILSSLGLKCGLQIMQSNGGLTSAKEAARTPVHVLESGPVGGIIAASKLCELLGREKLVSFDMGGTTAKASAIDGAPFFIQEYTLLGHVLRTPAIDIREIGKGGGSIARVDAVGGLHVGPESSGSDPGPACYGKGGTEPTVTDADLVLGKLNPEYFLGGAIKLQMSSAEKAFEKIAKFYGMNVVESANAVNTITDEAMTGAIRMVTVEKGFDPRDFSLVAFGGAGPTHATRLAIELEMPLVVIPVAPGNFSALGMLFSDLRHDYVQTFLAPLNSVDLDKVSATYQKMEGEGSNKLRSEGVKEHDILIIRSMDLRYVGQEHVLNVTVEPPDLDSVARNSLEESFNELHKSRYTFNIEKTPLEIVALRLTAIGKSATPTFRKIASGSSDPAGAEKKGRRIYLGADYTDCKVYERSRLKAKNQLEGPCIVEESGSTTVVYPDQQGEIDASGNILVSPM
ncbi:MAG: hydantoinase/oxoprolinase family protein [Thaumarchaeota archaeon]|nr:hydantoinase/oxoprolinase family protein [Nitrososphaerota archaeon]